MVLEPSITYLDCDFCPRFEPTSHFGPSSHNHNINWASSPDQLKIFLNVFFFLHLVLQQEIIHFMNYNNLQLILLSGWFHHLTPFHPPYAASLPRPLKLLNKRQVPCANPITCPKFRFGKSPKISFVSALNSSGRNTLALVLNCVDL